MAVDLGDAAFEVIDREAEHEDRGGQRDAGEVADGIGHVMVPSHVAGVHSDVQLVAHGLSGMIEQLDDLVAIAAPERRRVKQQRPTLHVTAEVTRWRIRSSSSSCCRSCSRPIRVIWYGRRR
ncbi:MAG: hypothetical protein H0V69_00535 [Acidimicrobiia bacterium]|nr:hypothetical protein [Acidimicrobiia bacterium]